MRSICTRIGRTFIRPLLRIPEVPTAFATIAAGGLLQGDRRVDVFNCLRKPDEVSFAGGVFVVVRLRGSRLLADATREGTYPGPR
jgi:hypothetical protein